METEATISEAIRRQATEWHTVMNSGEVDDAVRAKFEAWLHADRRHKRAYYEDEQVWRDLDFVAPAAGVDPADAMRSGLVEAWRLRAARWRRRPAFRPALAGAVAASVVLAVIATVPPQRPLPPHQPAYATQIAELEEIALDDGSVVTLGARSKMDVAFTEESRQVVLLAGEAFFDVAADESRPFFVAVDDTLIRVVGTKFDVKRATGDVHVSVLEGKVAVMKADAVSPQGFEAATEDPTVRLLTAGQKIVATQQALPLDIQQIEQATPGAWRSGRLAYENASLTEIIADVNRYSDRPIRIAQAELGDIRFTMGFQADQIETWLNALEASQPVRVEDRGFGEIVIRAKKN